MDNSSPETQEWFVTEVRLTQGRIRAYIRRLGVRPESVDDMAQEAYLTAFEKLNQFTQASDFGAWICQIARRQIANERRTEARRQRILSEEVTAHLLAHEDSTPEPLSKSQQAEELAALRQCVDQLPEKSRQLLHERYAEETRPAVIASRMGLSSNQVRQRLLRLRRTLLQCLKRQFGDVDLAGGGSLTQ